MPSRSRRQTVGGLAAAGVSATAAGAAATVGCAVNSPRSSGGGPEATPVLRSGVTVQLMTNVNQAVGEIQEGVVRRFQEQFPGIKVDHIPSTPDFNVKIQSMLAAGTPPDVTWAQGPIAALYSTQSTIADLTPLIRRDRLDLADFFKPALDAFVQAGKQVALPRDYVVRAIFYNVSLFQRFAVKLPPGDWNQGGWTFDTFLDASRQLGREVPADGPWSGTVTTTLPRWSTWVSANGGALLSADNKTCLLDQPPAIEALRYLQELMHRHLVHPTPQRIAEEGGDRVMFESGRSAMLEAVTGTTGQLRRITSFEWDVTHVPVGKGKKVAGGGGSGWVLPAQGKSQNEAWELIKHLTSKESVMTFTREGGVASARASVLNHPDVLNQHPPKSTRIFADGGQYAQTPPSIAVWPEVEKMMNDQVELLWRDNANVQNVVANIVRVVTPLLRG